ncbi:unnamed protein product [Menidia menidia]|uniref:Probable N-acetyltransferase 14 n=1 Tax=Menidia menidia TaxID=238744 RepID=A0A8S4BSJ3_9TELE|nr:unnamed protein product [Menidia menidia]
MAQTSTQTASNGAKSSQLVLRIPLLPQGATLWPFSQTHTDFRQTETHKHTHTPRVFPVCEARRAEGCPLTQSGCCTTNGGEAVGARSPEMVRLELDQVVVRRMREDDIEAVKALIKEGCEGTENRLILHILTRPLCLFILAVLSSILRCLVHSFLLALAIPVFLLIVFLKITMPRSTGVLGSSRPCWDYVGSSHRGTPDDALENPYCRISGKPSGTRKARSRIASKDKDKDKEKPPEKITPEREQAAGQVWVADCEGEIVGCIFRESEARAGVRRMCRLVTGCWYRREGLGRLLVQSLEQRERETGAHRVYAHIPYPSKVGEAFFRKVGYRLLGEGTDDEDEDELNTETPESGFMGYPLTKVFYKDL